MARIHSQLALVSPATLQFAEFVRDTLEPAFRRLQGVAAAGLLPGVEAAFKAMSPLINRSLRSLVILRRLWATSPPRREALTDPFWTKFFGYVGSTAGPTIKTMVHIVEDLGKGFARLLEAFAPVTKQLGKGLLDLAGNFAHFGATAGKNSGVQAFIDYVKREGPVIVQTLGSVGWRGRASLRGARADR